jgi:cation diffusion facilitator CzcD-associated flavoprotein CzcO
MNDSATETLDIVIIGAGFSGMYALHRLQRDYEVLCLEAGDGVGGTWYWNRYPGARVDIESAEYSYGFDNDLQQEWRWPELFAAQPDLERYANHVADRFALRDRIRLSTRVTRMRFDGSSNLWHVWTDAGGHLVCRYVIAATGSLTASNTPKWPGRESFRGQVLHTTEWPREGVDFRGKRVGLVGTGSSGVQAAPIIAEQAEHLYVFQRTPAFSMPSGNRPVDPDYERDWKAHYPERRKQMLETYGASLVKYPTVSALECSKEEQDRILEAAWSSRSAFQLLVCFTDVLTDMAANEVVCDFVRRKIRQIVKDPQTAELLCPTTYPIGGKRLCIDNGYYPMFNRDNVTLVDARATPITAFREEGLQTTERTWPLDVIVLATGFDALTGAMTRIDIEGEGGLRLQDKWREGPTTYFGSMVAGFPNLFMIHGPMTPSAQAQMITTGEWQVDWTARIIDDMQREGLTRIQTDETAEHWWQDELSQVANATVHRHADSWYRGTNIAGKADVFMIYVGGFQRFAQLCTAAVEEGYRGFRRS